MSAQPARPIRSLDNAGKWNARVILEDGTPVAVGDLKRAELMRVGKMAFPLANVRWGMVSNESILESLTTGDLPTHYADGSPVETSQQGSNVVQVTSQAPTNEPEPEPFKVEPDTSYSQPEPDPELEKLIAEEETMVQDTPERRENIGQAIAQEQSTGAAGDLERAIRAIAGSSVNAEQVRAIVQEEIATLPTPEQELDEEAVRAIVNDQVANLPIRRLEIAIRDQVNQVPDIHHEKLPDLVLFLSAGVHCYLVGPAGTGKSTMAWQAAEALGLSFHAMSLEPTMNAVKVFGYQDANGNYVSTEFRQAYENGGLMLLDEIDNGHPSVVAAMNQAMSNGYCSFADGMVKRHEEFVLVATANTFGHGGDREYVGRNQLDAATLDRFATLEILTDERMERLAAMAYSTEKSLEDCERWIAHVQVIRAKVQAAKVKFIVSPRASIEGCKLLSAGASWEQVEESRLWKGLSDDQRTKVNAQYVPSTTSTDDDQDEA